MRGGYSCKSLYQAMEQGGDSSFPVKVIWNPWVLLKVIFFSWEATWGKIPTLDQLKTRGWVANRCFLCLEEEESIDHISLFGGKS